MLCLFSHFSIADEIPSIAAASSVKFALEDIKDSFYQDTGKKIRISYSASGNLARQIQQGAPFELFLSANHHYVELLYHQNKTHDRGTVFAFGRLVLMTLKNSELVLDKQLSGIKPFLQAKHIQRFAIANPIHAPYGVAAKDVLKQLNVWHLTEPYLVFGENIAQAAQFTISGAAQAGLISYSLALAPELQNKIRFILLPSSLHSPLKQTIVLMKNASETSKLFFAYLQQEKARTILSQYGYALP